MVCGCVRKEEKKAKDETARVKDGEGAFFFVQERDDRWKEGLRRDKGRKKEKNETKEDDIKRKRRSDESGRGISGRPH